MPLSAEDYDLFQLRSRRLDASWTIAGAVFVVEVYVESGDDDVDCVAGCIFHRHRVLANGLQHPDDAAAQMEIARLDAEDRCGPRVDAIYANLIDAADEFRRRRLMHECTWEPTVTEEHDLREAIIMHVAAAARHAGGHRRPEERE